MPQCPPDQRITICYDAGRDDNFAGPIDPLTPRPAVTATPVGGTYTGFDDPTPNRLVGHTFRNLPCGIQTATLTITMRALCDISENDTLGLGKPTLWATSIAAIAPPWSCGQNATITLNLAALPGGGNIIPALNALHYLDMIVQDDTMIDSAKLTITVCPCDGPYRVIHAGYKDNLLPLPLDPPPYLRPSLAALRTLPPFLWNGFDNFQVDRGVGHSFSVPPGIIRAHLFVRAKPISVSGGGSDNDGISFELKNPGAPAAFYRGFNYSFLPVNAGTWHMPNNGPTTLFWDLLNTPPSDFSCPNFLGAMADGLFDVYSQDDTAIDWMDLKVWTCPPPRFDCGVPVNAVGQASLDIAPMNTVISNIGSGGSDGMRLEVADSTGWHIKLTPAMIDSLSTPSKLHLSVSGSDTGSEDGSSIDFANLWMQAPTPGHVEVTANFPNSGDGGAYIQIRSGGHATGTVYLPECERVMPEGDGTVLAITFAPVPDDQPGVETDAWCVDYTAPMTFVLSTGQVAQGDSFKIIRPVPGRERIAYATVGGEDLPLIRLVGVGPHQFGIPHRALGGATLETGPGTMTLANLGGTGQDGVEVDLGHAEAASFEFDGSLGDGTDEWPVGTSITASYTGSHGGSGDQYLGYTSVSKLPDRRHRITADYTPVGADLKFIQVLSNGELVREVANFRPPIIDVEPLCPPECLVAVNPSGCGKGAAILGAQRTACGRWHWPRPVRFLLEDGLVIEGDEIRILAQNANGPFDYVSRIALTTTGLDTLTISGETATPVGEGSNPCVADFNQDGGVDGADVQAFFAAWEDGQSIADVNQDGGVDGSDVSIFFGFWELGSC
ncbi:MAG: hypothetical protein JSR77_10125 [Planctomycetes bacterium]|nr:hypothetical protein [Planctomycetota bacterium]